MSSEPIRHLSPADYLAFERQSGTKHEYVNGETFAMTGASERHNLIVANLVIEIGLQLRDRPYRVYPSDLRVAVTPDGPFYYPDLVALCAEPRFLDGERDMLLNPELVIEVLSPTTEAFDRGVKFTHYRRLPPCARSSSSARTRSESSTSSAATTASGCSPTTRISRRSSSSRPSIAGSSWPGSTTKSRSDSGARVRRSANRR